MHHDKLPAHQSHFHVDLRAPVRVGLSQDLLTDNATSDQAVPVANEALITYAQGLLDQVKLDIDLNQGEVIMFIADMPNVPPQDVPVMIAQANQAQPRDVKTTRSIGVCSPAPNGDYNGQNMISPIGEAGFYLRSYEHRQVQSIGTITILQQPKHGILRLVTEADRGTLFGSTADPLNPADSLYAYLPEKGYLGKDSATFLVEIAGVKVKVVYFFQALGPGAMLGNYGLEELCGKRGYSWKISSTLDGNGNSTLTAVNYLPSLTGDSASVTDTAALAGTLGSNYQSGLVANTSGITLSFSDLPGGAIGQTNGTSITLDTTAAGHGWFIDSTPADNSEFLPTSNPNEWIAKAGTDAAGKMDMLSVLLHEYGHALGLKHSADSRDFMATTLTPGERRLPSTDELALMARLVGEIKSGSNDAPDTPQSPSLPMGTSLSALLIGRLRRTAYGSWSSVVDSVQIPAPSPQFDIAANATLTNGSLDTAKGWTTQGEVAIGSGTAVLNEVSNSQTRLNQVFMVGAQDRFLSFTLGAMALDDRASGPDDAFEVGLLDANSGASLAGALSLSRTDALLNLQANGAELAAQGVTHVTNADGSRSYLVDLRGIVAGTAVNLSFDLIGFGVSGSHAAVSEVRRIDSFSVSSLFFAKMISARRRSRRSGSDARAGTSWCP